MGIKREFAGDISTWLRVQIPPVHSQMGLDRNNFIGKTVLRATSTSTVSTGVMGSTDLSNILIATVTH